MAYNLGEAVGYIKLNIEQFTKSIEKVKSEVSVFESQISSLQNVFSKVEDVAVKAFAAIGTAAAAGLAKSIQIGSKFEASMSQVAATMGMTAEEITSGTKEYEALQAAAKEMGETTKFTASQAAEALNYLALAGYNAEESISSLPTVLNLAAAGGMDLATASDMLTDAVSALGLGLDDMSFFADQMAKTAQSSNTSVSQLGDAILQIGGTAKSLAGGVTELDTALGILANNGIKGAEAGTSLRQIILNLIAPTKESAEYMKELGLEIKDVYGNVRPLNDIFRDLDEILQSKGITGTADLTEALSNIFDARQLKSANALLANYGDTWDDLYEKIENAEGAAEIMAETMSNNLQGAITILGSAVEGLGIAFFEVFQKDLTEAVKIATNKIGELTKALKSNEMQEALSKVSSAFSDLVVKLSEVATNVIPKLVDRVAFLVDNFDKLKVVVGGLVGTIAAIAAGTALYTIQTNAAVAALIAQKIAQLAVNAAMLANPYTLAAVAVGALATAIIGQIERLKELKEEVVQQNTEYIEYANTIQKIVGEYEEAKEASEALKIKYEEEKSKVEELQEVINANVDSTGRIVSNYELVKSAIDELNQIIPTNITYTGNQIESYNNLANSIEEYNKKLIAKAELESRTSEYQAALKANKEAAGQQDELKNKLSETYDEYLRISEIVDKYNTSINYYNREFEELAKNTGLTAHQYAEKYLEDTKTALDSLTDTYQQNVEILSDTQQVMSDYTDDYLNLMWDAGEEVEGIYKNAAEAAEAAAKEHFATMDRLRQERADKNATETANEADEEISAEDELNAKLKELEIQFNLGIIKDEKTYHDMRLALFDEFTSEHTEKTAKWYKSEVDYQQTYQDNLKKQQEEEIKARQRAAEEAARAEEQKTKNLITEYDRRKEIDDKYTSEMYITDLEALADTLDKETDLYKDLYYKIEKYKKDSLKQQLNDEYKAIQDRKTLNENYSDEMYLTDLQAFADTLDKESDMYKDVVKEINKTTLSIKETQQKTANTAFESWEKGFDSLVSEAETAYNAILSKQKNLEDTLNNQIELYEIKTKKVKNATTGIFEDVEYKDFSTNYLLQQTKALEEYEKSLDNLKSRGVSDDLLQYITGLDPDEAQEYIAAFSKMSDAELKAYDDAYVGLKQKNKEFSERYYADEVEAFKTQWGDKITEYINSLPDEAKAAAKEYIEAFISGLEENAEGASGALQEVLKNANKSFTALTLTGNFENYGADMATAVMDGVQILTTKMQDVGTKSGDSLFNGFASISKTLTSWADNISKAMSESFMGVFAPINDLQNMLQNPKVIQSQMILTTAAVSSSDVNDMQPVTNAMQDVSNKIPTKDDIVNAIKQATPDGDIVLNIDGTTFGRVSRDSLNRLASASGDLNLNV